jgi:hypothetical protein
MPSVKIRPLDTAAQTIVTTVVEFKSLLIAFAIPEFARCLMFYMDSWLGAKNNAVSYFPFWLSGPADSVLASVTLVLMGRYLILGVKPDFLTRSLPWRPIALVSLLMIPLWLFLELATSSDISYQFYISAVENSVERDGATGVIFFTFYSYTLHLVLFSLIYPQFGIVAGTSDYNFDKHGSWNKRHFLQFLCIAVLLVASIKMVDAGYDYLWRDNSANYLPTTEAYFDWRKAVLLQLRYVPIDFLYMAIPAVVVSLVFKELRRADPTL